MRPKQQPFLVIFLHICLFCAGLHTSSAQGILSQRYSFEARQQPIGDALLSLSKTSGVTIGFSESMFEKPVLISYSAANQPLSSILNGILEGTSIGWREQNGQLLLYKKPPHEVILSGFVEDKDSGERLIGAIVSDPASGRSAVTNSYGFFSIAVPARTPIRLRTFYVGYQKTETTLSHPKRSTPLTLLLAADADLSEVIVSDNAVTSGQTNGFSSPKERNLTQLPINYLPAPGGERDLMRSAALLPGIGSSIDGLGGWSVRGGDLDQNRVMIDDALIFNPGHAMGLFSVISPDAVRSAQIWKGDAPARLGGSGASFLEVRTREGNIFRPSASASVGWVAGQILVEAPIKKERGAVLFSARNSFLGPLYRGRGSKVWQDQYTSGQSDYAFLDTNFKVNWKFNANNRVYLSLFKASDQLIDTLVTQRTLNIPDPSIPPILFTIRNSNSQKWQNQFASFRWNHLFSDKCFSNTTFTASQFDLESSSQQILSFWVNSIRSQAISQTRLRDFLAKTDIDWLLKEHLTVRAGAQINLTKILPFFYQGPDRLAQQVEWIEFDGDQKIIAPERDLRFETGITTALYGEAEWSPRRNILLRTGLRTETFSNQGKTWILPQPRFYVEKKWQKGFNSWFSANWMAQTVRTVSPAVLESVSDLWLLSSKALPPQHTIQFVIGSGLNRKNWSLRLEIFGKRMRQIEEYALYWQIDNASDTIFLDAIEYDSSGLRQWSNEIELGNGRAFGLEMLLEKKTGHTTGWASLSMGRSERKFNTLSQNKWFPARFDRLAQLKMAVVHQFNIHWSASAIWQYATGDAISSLLFHNDNKIRFIDLHRGTQPPERLGNGDYRQPPQHRLDVSIQYQWKIKRFQQCVSIGAYNVYQHKNRHYTFWTSSELFSNGDPFQQTINGLPFLPHLTWRGQF